MFGLAIFMSGGNSLQEPDETTILVLIGTLWFFSIIGWLDTGLVVHSTNTNIIKLTEFSSQYGIAILLSTLGIPLVIKRLFE